MSLIAFMILHKQNHHNGLVWFFLVDFRFRNAKSHPDTSIFFPSIVSTVPS
jgi:hypothetical protein